MKASDAVEHPFTKFAYTRGLGDRINIEKLRGYMFRRKWEVSKFIQEVDLSTKGYRPAAEITYIFSWLYPNEKCWHK